MADVGDLVYLKLVSSAGSETRVVGWAVDVLDSDVVVATLPASAGTSPQALVGKAGQQEVAFLRVPTISVVTSAPSNWTGAKPKDLPSFESCVAARFLRCQQWGKFKGICTGAVMDAVAYEYLRANRPEVAAAQCVQNMKAKLQAVI